MVVVLEERNVGRVTILECVGRQTAGEGKQALNDRIQALLAEGRILLLLDLSQVSIIYSQDISVLVRGFISTGRSGGKLKLLKLSPRVRQVLDATRLFNVLEAFDDEAAAVASFD
ncbi:MAG: STAS domain-containing protein [Terriglobia bacterium]|jgi:anti-anti-sigma factor